MKKNQTKTNEEFIKEVYNLVKDEYTFLDTYQNAKTKIRICHNSKKCNNYEYKVTPNDFLNGRRCPKCFGSHKKTTEEFKIEVYNLVKDEYTILEEYKNAKTKIKIRHNSSNCNNNEFETLPYSFLSGTRCPKCFGSYKKTTKEFKKEVYNLVKDEYTILEEYQNAQTKIKIRHNCNICNNYEYEVTPHNFLNGKRCPKCKESKGEKTIELLLNKKKINFKQQYRLEGCKKEKHLHCDFAIIKNEKLLGVIEFDGEQHFHIKSFGSKNNEKIKENFKKTKLRDTIKTTYCE